MKTYILSIAGVVLLSAALSVILPSGKMGKHIKGVMKILVLVVLVSPFTSAISKGTFSFPTEKIVDDTAYLERCAAFYSERDEEAVETFLENEFSVCGEVAVRRDIDTAFSRKKITIKITDFGIFGQDEHKDIMTRIQNAVEEKFGCTTEVA